MKRLLTSTTLVLALIGPGGTALASADEQASCTGLIISDHAQWGDMPELIQGARAFASAAGVPLGTFISSISRQHLGSHAVCGSE